MSVSEARYAHCDGFTDGIRFKDKYLATCGADGELRIWETENVLEEGPLSVALGSQCNSVCVQGDSVLCATDGFRVQKLTPIGSSGQLVSEAELEPALFRRFEAEVLHVTSDASNSVVVCLVNGTAFLCREPSSDISLDGHRGPVLSGAIADGKPLLATAGCDGSVRVWSTADGRSMKKLEDVFSPQEGVESLHEVTRWHRVAFHDAGRLLIVACERSVKLFETNTFTLEKEVDVDEIIDDEEVIFTMATDASRICISTNQGLINVYLFPELNSIWSHKLDDTVTSIMWPLPKNPEEPTILLSEKGELMCVSEIGAKKTGAGANNGVMEEDVFDPDEEILAGTGIDRAESSGAKRKRKASDVDGILDNDSNAARDVPDDDDDGVDLGAIKSNYMPTILGETDGDTEGGARERVIVRETVRTIHVKAFHQEPFQAGQVPEITEQGYGNEDDDRDTDTVQERRFLTYNHVGFVVCSITTEESSIDVDFHNSSDRHPLTLPNKAYTMAALDGHALVLASELEMMVYLLEPQAGESSSWEEEVKDDAIVGVALGPGFIAMATQNHLLRLFSPGGIQREVLVLPGPLVCMVGASMFSLRAQELRPLDNLMVFYHQGTGLDDRQSICCMRLKVSNSGVTTRGTHVPVGLPRKVRIVWAGYSEEFRPSYMNSKGILFIYSDRMGSWYPVFDSKDRLGHTSSCFVVSVGERYNRLLYVSCKQWSPRVRPLPVMVKEKLQIPLLDVASDKGQLETRYLRLRQLPAGEVESGLAKLALQMFALALKSDRLTRAADIIRMESGHKDTLQLFMEYTHASNRVNRYDGLLRLLRQFLDEGEDEGQQEQKEVDEVDMAEIEDPNNLIVQNDEAEPITQQLIPVAPILAPKRIVLGSLDRSNAAGGDVNPFKKSSTAASKTAKSGNLDDLLSKKISKPSTTPRPDKAASDAPTRLGPKQVKLSSASLAPKSDRAGTDDKRSPLQLFMSAIIDELKTERPDGNNDDWLKMAAQRFRHLTTEERASYLELSRNPSKRPRVDS